MEVIDEIRKNMPEGMPLFIRIDAQDDMLENGLTIEDVIRFCKIAKEHGVDGSRCIQRKYHYGGVYV